MGIYRRLQQLPDEVDRLLVLAGATAVRAIRTHPPKCLSEAEFRVFSQFGEDGIIQHLIGRIPIENEIFVEIGVEDYRESNTRFLLVNDNWRGVIVDAGTAHVDFIKQNPIGWRHDITALSSFVTRDNVNEIIRRAGLEGDVGLLSIDIDGNDYWVLRALEVVAPRILVAEYNSTFGPDEAVTVPYDEGFDRASAHHSHLYWGASISALTIAARDKGLALVGGNRAGNNAFFVKRELLGDLPEVTPQQAWRESRFREARDEHGRLTYLSGRRQKLEAIADLPLIRVPGDEKLLVSDL